MPHWLWLATVPLRICEVPLLSPLVGSEEGLVWVMQELSSGVEFWAWAPIQNLGSSFSKKSHARGSHHGWTSEDFATDLHDVEHTKEYQNTLQPCALRSQRLGCFDVVIPYTSRGDAPRQEACCALGGRRREHGHQRGRLCH